MLKKIVTLVLLLSVLLSVLRILKLGYCYLLVWIDREDMLLYFDNTFSVKNDIFWLSGIILITLLILKYFKQPKRKITLLKLGMITGFVTCLVYFFILVLFVKSNGLNGLFIVLHEFMFFVIGFLIPFFYKMVSKKTLYSENFF